MREDQEKLQDILEAIDRVEKYSVRGRESFWEDELIQVWIIHHLQIIGEAANEISEGLKNRANHIPWKEIIGLRHVLVHHYFGIDLEVIWDIVQKDLPLLKTQVQALFQQMGDG